ncbi:melanocortin receptor 5-like [Oculina patagonica]
MALDGSLLNENFTTNVNSGSAYSESNNTEDRFRERHVPIIVNCALNTPLSVTAILGNTVVIYSIWNNPFLHSPSNMLLFGLAICDLCVGITVQPFYIIYQSFYLTNRLQTWRATMEVFNIVSNLICGVSFLTTTAITIDRYLAIHLHLRYREFVTMRGTVAVLVVLWIISAFVASTLIWNSHITFFAVASVIAVCLFVTFGVYVKIFTVVRHHRRRIQASQRRETTQQFGNTRRSVKSAIIFWFQLLVKTMYQWYKSEEQQDLI